MVTKNTAKKIRATLKRSRLFTAKWERAAKDDLRFALGDQWTKAERDFLDKQLRPALTFNIIQPLIFLASGYQRQSRASIKAFPIGGEDQLKSDIATLLLKKTQVKSNIGNKLSQTFENGIITGKGFIEPVLDYTNNLVNPDLKLKNSNAFKVYVDPDSVEYDLSDAGYIIKEADLTRDRLCELFPDKRKLIQNIEVTTDNQPSTVAEDGDLGIPKGNEDDESTYGPVKEMEDEPEDEDEEEAFEPETLNYIEYWYKKYVPQYLAADPLREVAEFFHNRQEAEACLAQAKMKMPVVTDKQNGLPLAEKAKVIERFVPEIWVTFVIEDKVIKDIISPFYPQWKQYPIFPFFAHYTEIAKSALQDEELAFQGIVRNLKDPQKEKNKRRSQALHLLNTSANGGWLAEEGSFVSEAEVKKLGSSPGILLKYKKGAPKPEKIYPTPVSQGHILLENEAAQDIKLISGINADMLAMDDKTISGKAIALRQQQGVIILKRLFDNFSWTQEIVGRFILSQLGTIYSTETAARTLGEDFIMKNNVTPEVLESVLKETEEGEFDIEIGEGQDSPTERYAIFMQLSELAGQGMAIPPNILLEYADIPDSSKREIIAMQQQAAAQIPLQPQG